MQYNTQQHSTCSLKSSQQHKMSSLSQQRKPRGASFGSHINEALLDDIVDDMVIETYDATHKYEGKYVDLEKFERWRLALKKTFKRRFEREERLKLEEANTNSISVTQVTHDNTPTKVNEMSVSQNNFSSQNGPPEQADTSYNSYHAEPKNKDNLMVSKDSLQLFQIFDKTRQLHAQTESTWASMFDDPADKSTMMGVTAGAPCSEIGINKAIKEEVGMAKSNNYLRKKQTVSPSAMTAYSRLYKAARHKDSDNYQLQKHYSSKFSTSSYQGRNNQMRPVTSLNQSSTDNRFTRPGTSTFNCRSQQKNMHLLKQSRTASQKGNRNYQPAKYSQMPSTVSTPLETLQKGTAYQRFQEASLVERESQFNVKKVNAQLRKKQRPQGRVIPVSQKHVNFGKGGSSNRININFKDSESAQSQKRFKQNIKLNRQSTNEFVSDSSCENSKPSKETVSSDEETETDATPTPSDMIKLKPSLTHKSLQRGATNKKLEPLVSNQASERTLKEDPSSSVVDLIKNQIQESGRKVESFLTSQSKNSQLQSQRTFDYRRQKTVKSAPKIPKLDVNRSLHAKSLARKKKKIDAKRPLISFHTQNLFKTQEEKHRKDRIINISKKQSQHTMINNMLDSNTQSSRGDLKEGDKLMAFKQDDYSIQKREGQRNRKGRASTVLSMNRYGQKGLRNTIQQASKGKSKQTLEPSDYSGKDINTLGQQSKQISPRIIHSSNGINFDHILKQQKVVEKTANFNPHTGHAQMTLSSYQSLPSDPTDPLATQNVNTSTSPTPKSTRANTKREKKNVRPYTLILTRRPGQTNMDLDKKQFLQELVKLLLVVDNHFKKKEVIQLANAANVVAFLAVVMKEFTVALKIYSLTAQMYLVLKHFRLALDFYNKMRNCAHTAKDLNAKMYSYKQMGHCFAKMQMYNQAITCFKQMLQIAWVVNSYEGETQAYDSLSIMHFYLGDLKRSEYYARRYLRGHTEASFSQVRKISNNQTLLAHPWLTEPDLTRKHGKNTLTGQQWAKLEAQNVHQFSSHVKHLFELTIKDYSLLKPEILSTLKEINSSNDVKDKYSQEQMDPASQYLEQCSPVETPRFEELEAGIDNCPPSERKKYLERLKKQKHDQTARKKKLPSPCAQGGDKNALLMPYYQVLTPKEAERRNAEIDFATKRLREKLVQEVGEKEAVKVSDEELIQNDPMMHLQASIFLNVGKTRTKLKVGSQVALYYQKIKQVSSLCPLLTLIIEIG